MWWWVAWVVWGVLAGALAGVGLIEFNWGGPPYDGGFLGELALFGGFLALGQAPFVGLFVGAMYGRAWRNPDAPVAAVFAALCWPLVGFVGWVSGSYLEVGLGAPLYSDLAVLAGVLPWVLVGTLQGLVMVAVLASTRGLRAAVASGGGWALASAAGGILYEYWRSFDVAARQNFFNDAIGRHLQGAGVAENVAYGVVPNALFVPLLYGVPTGLALVAIRSAAPRREP